MDREKDNRGKLEKLEFLYELDPNKPLMKYKNGTESKETLGGVQTGRFNTGNSARQDNKLFEILERGGPTPQFGKIPDKMSISTQGSSGFNR